MQEQPVREQTFGEKAVGLTFNPPNDSNVRDLKQLYAQIIDKLESIKATRAAEQDTSYMDNTLSGMALRDAIRAQMSAVKYATWGL